MTDAQLSRKATLELFHKYLSLPDLDIETVFSEEEVNKIDYSNSIILFHANWSGQSVMASRLILEKIKDLKLKTTMTFFVDIDCVIDGFVYEILGKRCHGMGEAVLYNNGKIVARHNNAQDFHLFMEYIAQHAS
jgi:hypothetical protein